MAREISRRTPDIEALKALAHRDRLRLLSLLRLEGPATATLLARRTGLNSGATSYHLRQLAQHGFIEPAEQGSNRRERWWRAAHESTTFDTAGLSGEDLETGLAFTQAVLASHALQLQRAQQQFRELPAEWRRATNTSDFAIPLTAPAAEALNEQLMEVLWAAKSAAPAPGEPLEAGSRHVTFILYSFPRPDDVDPPGKAP